VIDQKEGLNCESLAITVQARTLETYDILGIVEHALTKGIPAAVMIYLRRASPEIML
jgi:hypothetical protein